MESSQLIDDSNLDRIESMFTRLTKLMADSFNASVKELVVAIEHKLDVKIEAQGTEIFSLNQRITLLESKLESLTSVNATLTEKLNMLSCEQAVLHSSIDNLDQYSRVDSVLIHGVPTPQSGQSENLYITVPALLNTLLPAVKQTSESISVIHRLPTTAGHAAAASTNTPPPVIMKLISRQTKSALMTNRKLLKGKQVVITDHLTPARSALLKKATTMASSGSIQSAWSQDGRILVRSLQNRTVQFSTENDLRQFN